MNIRDKPIGIFDSGVGGLTVLRAIEKIIPSEDVVYFGDTARVPYGNKSRQTIVRFSTENTIFLLKKKVKIIIVACNTSSSFALDYLQSVFNIPILGVIEAGARRAVDISAGGKVGVIGTKATIGSKAYETILKRISKDIAVYAQSCPLFVPLVEEGILKGAIVEQTLRMYLGDFRKKKIDTIILGCTHYPLLKKAISSYLNNVNIVDSAQEVARHTKKMLICNGLMAKRKRKGSVKFYVSDETDGFARLARLFLKRPIVKPEIVNV